MKKKLYKQPPPEEQQQVHHQVSKRRKVSIRMTCSTNERRLRQQLAQRISGTHLGLMLLLPFHLKLGTWPLLQQYFGTNSDDLACRMALQMVNEAAICTHRIRAKNTLCNQGFSIVNGLCFLPTDEQIHQLSYGQTIQQSLDLQLALARRRKLLNHYNSANILALDPHRIVTHSGRIMPQKKKKPKAKSAKMMQTFFCNDALSGQPFGFGIASPGRSCTKASMQLINFLDNIGLDSALLLADTEHYTVELLSAMLVHPNFNIIVPAPKSKRIRNQYQQLDFQQHWPGYAIACSPFQFKGCQHTFQLIVQRTGLTHFFYKPFISTSQQDAFLQINQLYPQRWSIEDFFNFEGHMGWNRAATMNLNVRFAKQTAALLAQAACFELKQILPQPFKQWTAPHMAKSIFLDFDGDLKVSDDTILITFYGVPQHLKLHEYFTNLPQRLIRSGINPKVPWLFDFKVDFVFK